MGDFQTYTMQKGSIKSSGAQQYRILFSTSTNACKLQIINAICFLALIILQYTDKAKRCSPLHFAQRVRPLLHEFEQNRSLSHSPYGCYIEIYDKVHLGLSQCLCADIAG